MTWAFATGTCGSEDWTGVSPAAFAAANVQAWASAGKRYIVATGGAGGSFFCTSDAAFTKFITSYYSSSMIGVDFDIESNQTQTDINNLVQRCVTATAAYPNMRWSFTVPVEGPSDGSDPFGGAGSVGYMVTHAIKQFGLKNYTVNLMAMDFANVGGASPSLCVVVNGRCQMGQSAIQAAVEVHKQYGVPYGNVEITVLVGGNDSSDEVFTMADVPTVSNFIKANGVAGLHYWEFNRDNDCAPNTGNNGSSDTCNDYGQAGTLGFTKAFLANGL